ncbi:hypothetical protein NHH03_27620 [Stieleria sp. TO1_6]|uniref:DUF6932 family protein n=1 Tax=Stieleria tagensis TaxID=2956795 RepID=UPI00209B52BD|nr:hypothetical protein [Stieleria tagensis]MCO8125539.1 hypothetical protein [Stieleria tagensis]
MIPPFNSDDNLPAGIHLTDWKSFSVAFGISAHRSRLISGLVAAMVPLRQAGCKRIYIDGSFVTAKVVPNDYDVAWDPLGVDLLLLKSLEPLFFDFANARAAQKAKFLGEFFPSSQPAEPAGRTFLEFFQVDKNTGNQKGIVALDL